MSKAKGKIPEKTIISINTFEEIATDKNTIKTLNFLLVKSNEQNHNPDINFNLKELVENGMYENIDTARKGFINSIEKIMRIEIGVTVKQGKREIRNEEGYLFYDTYIKNSFVTVKRNEYVDIEFLAPYITIIPTRAYQLEEKGEKK